MYHVALDRAGADDRDLDHQIVEAARAEARQEIHLRPALDLEDAEAVRAAEHVVDRRVLRRQAGQRIPRAVFGGDQIEGLADAGQHAERQDVDLEDAERVDVVLVPADHRAVVHRGVLDGHQLVEPAFGDDETADMLREVAGKADDLVDERQRLGEAAVGGVEADLGQAFGAGRTSFPSPRPGRRARPPCRG